MSLLLASDVSRRPSRREVKACRGRARARAQRLVQDYWSEVEQSHQAQAELDWERVQRLEYEAEMELADQELFVQVCSYERDMVVLVAN